MATMPEENMMFTQVPSAESNGSLNAMVDNDDDANFAEAEDEGGS